MVAIAQRGAGQIPRTIWLMWWQGLAGAPELVKRCYSSWQHHNPDWNIVLLDETNVQAYVDIQEIRAFDSNIRLQALSDIIRVHLLAQHGGVWVDATCFCCRPLDDWLADHARPGFFAFHKPSRSRLLDAWFIASSADCHLSAKLLEATDHYWSSNHKLKLRPSKTLLDRLILKLLSTSVGTTQLWFSYPVRKWLKIYPYMWLPFLFAQVLRADPRSRQVWRDVKKISADLPHRLQKVGLLEPLTEAVKTEIDTRQSPVYKLNWRYDEAHYDRSVLQSPHVGSRLPNDLTTPLLSGSRTQLSCRYGTAWPFHLLRKLNTHLQSDIEEAGNEFEA